MTTDYTTKEIIKKWYSIIGFDAKYDSEFNRALDEVYVDPTMDVEDYDKDDPDGRRNFLYYLYFCEQMHARYIEKGISEDIFLDNLGDIKAWLDVWSELKGEMFLGEIPWLWYTLTLRIIKLGRLQYNRKVLTSDVPEAGLFAGDSVLDIHIPTRGALTKDECLRSLQMSRSFFKQYYPEFEYKCFVCYSWLLDTGLSDILPSDSNILAFQRLFNIVKLNPSSSIMHFVLRWQITKEEIKDFECKTSLQRKVKAALLDGTQFMSGYGIIRK